MSAEAIPCSNALSRIDVGPRAGTSPRPTFGVAMLLLRLIPAHGVGIVFKEAVGKWAHRAAAIP